MRVHYTGSFCARPVKRTAIRDLGQTVSSGPGSSCHICKKERTTQNVNLGPALREPQQMNARFKLVTGSQRRDEQDPINVGVIVGLSGAYQAKNASQSPPFELFFDAAKVEKQLPTRTAKSV